MNKIFKTISTAALAITGIVALQSAAQADIAQLKGTWVNNNSSGLAEVRIKGNLNRGIKIRAFGSCSPSNCDWGRVRATPFTDGVNQRLKKADHLMATFNQGHATKTVLVDLINNNRIKVTTFTDFNAQNRRDYRSVVTMKRKRIIVPQPVPQPLPIPVPLPMPMAEDCIPFNPSSIRVEHRNGGWAVTDGYGTPVFAPTKQEARKVARQMRAHRITKNCYIGRPNASMRYSLKIGNKAPKGAVQGEDCIGFNKNNLSIRHDSGGRWLLTDGGSRMETFPNKKEAKMGLAVIKKYGFTKQCFVGRPDPSFSYWRK
ncbi:hypothetical protein N9K16_02810 [Alphaproteobacteria bacterium]|nr:hypothetical protein [Alphaproteobacteria bacterium]